MFNIPAGRLRHSIDIEQRIDADDNDYGGSSSVWTPLHNNVRAEIRSMSGGELVDAKASVAEVSIKVRFRFIPGLTAAHRATIEGKVYSFSEAPRDIDGNMRWLEVLAVRKEGA